eukprot:166720-Hanusia_phi.AAC.2
MSSSSNMSSILISCGGCQPRQAAVATGGGQYFKLANLVDDLHGGAFFETFSHALPESFDQCFCKERNKGKERKLSFKVSYARYNSLKPEHHLNPPPPQHITAPNSLPLLLFSSPDSCPGVVSSPS